MATDLSNLPIQRRISKFRIAITGLVTALILALASSLPFDATAQTNSIVAVVNDDAITSFDLDQRIAILLFTSGLPNTEEQRAGLEQRVLQTLVDERLKMQEAARLGIALAPEEFESSIGSLERSNRLSEGELPAFAQRNGFAYEALENQVRSDLTWQKVVIQTERENVQVSDDKIDEIMDHMAAAEGETEYRVAEILMLADERAGVLKPAVLELANDLVTQMRDGTRFSAVARQFSDSPSATNSGDIGWMVEANMPPAMAGVIPSMSLGSISEPIEEDRGYRIYGLIGRRLANTSVTSDTEVSVRLLVLPLGQNPSESQVRAKVEEANRMRSSISNCAEFRSRAAVAGTPQPPTPTRLKLGDVNPQIRGLIAGLGIDQISEPLPSSVGVQLIIVCDREFTSNLPSRAEVQENLMRERAEAVSRRRLRDLRRAAFIEYR